MPKPAPEAPPPSAPSEEAHRSGGFFISDAEAEAINLALNNFLIIALALGFPSEKSPANYDSSLTKLQRIRPLLQKYAPVAKPVGFFDPIEALDHIARKILKMSGQRQDTASVAAAAARFLGALLLSWQKQETPGAPIDPEKLRTLN